MSITTTTTINSTLNWSTKLCTTPSEIETCLKIRIKVFVEEQKFTMEDEIDEKDSNSDHFLLFENDLPIGTIRWYGPLNKLGRLAVLKESRGTGAGKKLVKCLEDYLFNREGKSKELNKDLDRCLIVANSQKHAQGFYEKSGYIKEGDYFLEDGELHIRMIKILILSSNR